MYTLNTYIDPVMCTESTHFGSSILGIPFSCIKQGLGKNALVRSHCESHIMIIMHNIAQY